MKVARRLNSPRCNRIQGKRIGIMLHFDGSVSDAGAVSWFLDPKCNVSYNYLVLDNGDVVEVAPPDKRAWHAGVCRPSDPRLPYSDANSAFYGIAAATNHKTKVTEAQKAAIVELCRTLYDKHGWPRTDTHRITGHSAEAWKRGRKVDPEGYNAENPILSVEEVRGAL